MINKLPLYEITVSETDEAFVDAIALVDNPAIESNFLAFSEHKELRFAYDDEKQELMGAAMIPDLKIFRKDESGNGYEVFFSKKTIRQIAQIFFSKGFQKNLNMSHTPTPANSYVFQSYIVDAEKGIHSPKGLNVPDGSWIVGVKVTSPEVWSDVKNGKVKGFSVEGLFNLSPATEDQDHRPVGGHRQPDLGRRRDLSHRDRQMVEQARRGRRGARRRRSPRAARRFGRRRSRRSRPLYRSGGNRRRRRHCARQLARNHPRHRRHHRPAGSGLRELHHVCL